MGGYRDEMEALRARIDALESELRRAGPERDEKVLAQVSALRAEVERATGQLDEDRGHLADIASRLSELSATFGVTRVVRPPRHRWITYFALAAAIGASGVMLLFLASSDTPEPTSAAPGGMNTERTRERPAGPSRSQVLGVLESAADEVADCGQGRRGAVIVRVQIAGSTGTVRSAEVRGPTLEGTGVSDCVEGVLLGLRFPTFERKTFAALFTYSL